MTTSRSALYRAHASQMTPASGSPRILHLVDSLDVGGTERVAVNLSNLFARAGHQVVLCTTRRDGPLAGAVDERVERLCLERRFRFQPGPLRRLLRAVDELGIDVIHAHSTSLFLAVAARRLRPRLKVVWHDHFGRSMTHERRPWLYRRARPDAVVSVNRRLRQWASHGRVQSADRLHYLPNFSPPSSVSPRLTRPLPGNPDAIRITIAANLRPQKGHEVLLDAFALARAADPRLELMVCGDGSDERYSQSLEQRSHELGLERWTHFLGNRNDLEAVLAASHIGVLSSHSEGLPLALLEYGRAGLPVVTTDVGDCAEVLDNGSCGYLVAPGDAPALACALLHLAQTPEQRDTLGRSLSARVASHYGPESTLDKLLELYEHLLAPDRSVS